MLDIENINIMITKFNVEKTRNIKKLNRILSLFYRKPKRPEPIQNNKIRNILIIDFSLMGDMIMDIPFIKTLRHNTPNAKITMVCMTWGEVILGDQGLVDEFIIFDGKNKLSSPKQVLLNFREIKHTIKKINTKKYDVGFEPKGDLRHTLFLHYTNCFRTVTYNYTGGDYLVTDSFSPKLETRHLIDEKLDLLELSGFCIFDDDKTPQLSLSEEAQNMAKAFLIENGINNKQIIGVHPGASNINKQYCHYPELVKKIANNFGEDVVFAIFEGPGEKEIVDSIVFPIAKENIHYVRIKRDTREYVALVSICNYMICNDSAAGHIAAAYGIPVVVVFGPVKMETALPRGTNKVIGISHDIECKPCTLSDCPLGTDECIKNVTVEELYSGFTSILSN